MTELMIKMTSWLVAAMALGFIVAWLLSKIIYQRKQKDKEETFSTVIFERNNMIDKLEKNFRKKTKILEKLSADLKDSQELLAEKTSKLTTLQHRLKNSTSNANASKALSEQNNLLSIEIQKLKEADIKRVGELEGFEEILLFAEKKIEENEKSYRQVLKKLDEDIELLSLENEKYKKDAKLSNERIINFKEELKLYEANSSEPEFIISKDQFVKIEEQLETYQKEIDTLTNENSELLLKSQKSFNGYSLEHRILEDKAVDELRKESDDSSMVKAFRETYKKITRS